MYRGDWKSKMRVHASNIPGWCTNRHIVVIESDDWGSIRMPSIDSFKRLKSSGIPVDKDHYNINDALESNEDLEMLFDTLKAFTDSTGRHPVMTGVNVVANPDFKAIRANEFTKYVFEPYTRTCEHYPNHDRVYELWKLGIAERLFVPILHGREHLNVQFWMRALREGMLSATVAFEESVSGIPRIGIGGETVPDFQAAFDIDTQEDIVYQREVIETGGKLFEELYGYKPKYFVPTNGPFNNSLEKDLLGVGVKYINTGKKQREPLGDGRYRVNTRFLGSKNALGQIYLTRNCFFEPAATGFEVPADYDWLNYCLKEIEIAFRWHKPATISSHRVNYIGFLHPENRERGLKMLRLLLDGILKHWPDVEFMTSVELGDLIVSAKQ
jgi:hypothetical protein